MKRQDEFRAEGADNWKKVWAGIKARYDHTAHEPMPERMQELLKQLDAAEARAR